ncbi:GIN domain-containing protein [Spirosoma spitsbergense]|uniref:GIN domain-containing protein n=1 Tax=Spirosoma spitsbergense TaxID=431554 RepID=UPI0012F9DE78|nr:DUF2807 domain-containing protein [Spirosoma spitsbergense]
MSFWNYPVVSYVFGLSIELSGASKGEFIGEAVRMTADISGASALQLNGRGTALSADLSGVSSLQAFPYSVGEATVDASGASKASVNVSNVLVVDASGASAIRYRGTPTVRQRVTGSSTVQNE